ncbi:MAG: hypothetical protein DWI59_05535 [Chloroflexi bacterium]|nr:MAG: hypothetical protein DWI59_05535 [Chloroflexota bacterium]
MPIPEHRLRSVVFEALRRDFGSQWLGLTQAVAWVATDRGLYPALQDTRIVQIHPADAAPVRALVDELVADGVLSLGIPGGSTGWPRLSLTAAGREVVFAPDDAPDSPDLG